MLPEKIRPFIEKGHFNAAATRNEERVTRSGRYHIYTSGIYIYRYAALPPYGPRSGIVFQRIRKRKATSSGVCSELCDGGRGSYKYEARGNGLGEQPRQVRCSFRSQRGASVSPFIARKIGLQPHANG